MGSQATNPPWMPELVRRHPKIVRNMWSSDGSYFDDKELSQGTTRGSRNPVVDPLLPSSTSSAASGATIPETRGKSSHRMATVVLDQMRRTNTEKSSPIREDSGFMGDHDDDGDTKIRQHYLRNGEEENILEYGPGIVRKLRSRYQSLALRQFSTRPSLRRSASLENVLDGLDSSGEGGIMSPSPAPSPMEDNARANRSLPVADKVQDNTTSGMSKSKSASTVLENASNRNNHHYEQKQSQQREGEHVRRRDPVSRGRANQSEKRDKMRRARSVDALHRTKHEEEILEKFKAVVLPKEEIVIIEVSKPRANLNGLGLSNNNSAAYYLGTLGDKAYPTHLLISTNDRTTGDLTTPAVADNNNQQSGIRSSRSFISPEHELPPHDIVRETARIFEKNQENLLGGANKKIGQALRLSKSPSVSSISSTPPPLSPTPHQQQSSRGTTVMAQGVQSMQQQVDLAEKTATIRDIKSPSSLSSSITTTTNANHAPHGLKQVGIIRPTVSHPSSTTSPTGNNNLSNISNGVARNERPALSPILSPSQNPYKTFLQQQSQSKPPLSPKPIFTSSPKLSSAPPVPNRLARTNSTESPLATQPPQEDTTAASAVRNVDSPVNNKSQPSSFNNENVNRIKSPTLTPEKQFLGGLSKPLLNGNSPTFRDSKENSREASPKPTGRDSPSSRSSIKRQLLSDPLKHVPNSFTLDSSPTIHEPVHHAVPRPAPRSTPPAPQVNGHLKTIAPPIPVEPPRVPQREFLQKTATASKIEESTPKVLKVTNANATNNNINNKPAETNKVTKAPLSSPPPPPVVRAPLVNTKSAVADNSASQLRVHQKQKSNQGNNPSMVFNFTTRSSVPDYIEDDGLHRDRLNLAGTVTDESVDDLDSPDSKIDIKKVKFEGANVIINGRSSIQKKPKSKRMSISFNESATTTYEYPSEASILSEEDSNTEKDMLGHKGPNVLNNSGNGLGSYTPKQANNGYQLGNFVDPAVKKSDASDVKSNKKENELIEDYLKPDSETTTWSNELTADILF